MVALAVSDDELCRSGVVVGVCEIVAKVYGLGTASQFPGLVLEYVDLLSAAVLLLSTGGLLPSSAIGCHSPRSNLKHIISIALDLLVV